MNKMVQEVLASFKKVLFCHALFSFCVVGIVYFLKGQEEALIWFIGCLLGFIDTLLMFNGVRKGMLMSGEDSLQEMRRTLAKRFAIAVALVLVMLKLELSVLGVLMGFILTHIFLLFNLIIIASHKR
ncbi:MAG: ATP synthase subunit I [Acidaminococcaceae bacterium]